MAGQLSFGDLIRQQREALGLTQARLAQLVGKSPSTIRSWERDRSRPADETSLSTLIAVLGLPDNQLRQVLGGSSVETAEEVDQTTAPSEESAPGAEEPSGLTTGDGDNTPEEVATANVAGAVSGEPVATPMEGTESETIIAESVRPAPKSGLPARRSWFWQAAGAPRPPSAVSSRPRVPSYLDDPNEVRTYRLRTVLTAALLVLMFIVLTWAIGEARDAFGVIFADPVP